MPKTSPSEHARKSPHWSARAAAVFGAGFTFIIMAISGLVLIISPRGSMANKIDGLFGGLDRHGWQAIHLSAGILFLVVALWHIILHLPVIENLTLGSGPSVAGHRSELLLMLAGAALFLLTAIFNPPPSSWLIEINEYFNCQYWAPLSRGANSDKFR